MAAVGTTSTKSRKKSRLISSSGTSFSFNLFFLRYDIVCFGVSGISIVLSEFGVNPSVFILCTNIVLMIVAYFALGFDNMKNQLVGALSYPIFVSLTSMITKYIDLGNTEMDVIIEIVCKWFKLSMGNASLIVNGIIVIIGKIVFSWDIVLYAILVSYLISVFTDKVLLGISKCKAFYIVTDKKKTNIVKEFLLSIDGVGVTLMEAEGGYSKNDESLLLAVVPSKSYFIVKDGLKEIDNKMFFLVCDSYEVSEKGDFS